MFGVWRKVCSRGNVRRVVVRKRRGVRIWWPSSVVRRAKGRREVWMTVLWLL